jgi:hypothetical protein
VTGQERTSENVLADVAAATVRNRGYQSDHEKTGLGVLAGSGLLLTAAHCLEFDNDSGSRLVLGEHVHFEVETAGGDKLKAAPLFIESISDIAALGPLDRYAYDDEWVDAYESFRERTLPVALWKGEAPRPSAAPCAGEFGIRIRTHDKRWISGTASVFLAGRPHLWMKTDERIDGRMSGGPIVNDSGELVSVVTAAGGYLGTTNEGHAPLLRHALPDWLFRAASGA